MAYINEFNTATPVGSNAPNVLDDSDRNIKAGLQERVGPVLYGVTDGEIDSSKNGVKVLPFNSQAAGAVVAKTGKYQIYQDENGNWVAMNGSGTIIKILTAAGAVVLNNSNYIAGCELYYDSVEPSYVKVRIGELTIDSTLCQITTALKKQVGAGTGWWYVYLTKSTAVLTASDITISATAPAASTTGRARYLPTDSTKRYIRAVYCATSQVIRPFAILDNSVNFAPIEVVAKASQASNIAYTAQGITTSAPATADGVRLAIRNQSADGNSASVGVAMDANGVSERIFWQRGDADRSPSTSAMMVEIPIVGGSQEFYYKMTLVAGYTGTTKPSFYIDMCGYYEKV